MTTLDVASCAEGVTLRIFVKPRASKSHVGEVHEGALTVLVKAPPVDGEANREVVRTLARHFAVPRSAVVITAGHKGRRKRVQITGLEVDAVMARLGL